MKEQPILLMLGTTTSDHLHVTIAGRVHPNDQDYQDGNWLRANITVKIGGFNALIHAKLRTESFVRFRQQLSHLQARMLGEAVFKSMENWLTISVKLDRSGQMITDCTVQDTYRVDGMLNFKLTAISVDDVPNIIQTLDAIITTFPVVDQPPLGSLSAK